jgi:capsular polysaccharide transport system permease protein
MSARRLRTPRTVGALVLREVQSAHGRSAAGYLWAVAEPVAGILLLTAVFSIAFHAPPLGGSFAFFYASALLPFAAYLDVSQKVAQSIRFSRPLLLYPGVRPVDAILARFLLGALTQAVVTVLVLSAMIPALGIDTLLDPPALVLALAMALWLALGAGTLNCALCEVWPAWDRVWAIANRPLFIVSAVFFLYEAVPSPYRDWLWWNPLVHVVGQMRRALYPVYEGTYVTPSYVFALGGVALVLGLGLLARREAQGLHG